MCVWGRRGLHTRLMCRQWPGGLATPHLIQRVVWMLYNGTGLSPHYQMPITMADPRLADPTVRQAVALEAARLFPEVTHVPLDRPQAGTKELLSIEAALRDASVWGDDAEFVYLGRNQSLDGPYGLAWAVSSWANACKQNL